MKMKLWVLLGVASGLAFAQQPAAATSSDKITKLVRLQHIRGDVADLLANMDIGFKRVGGDIVLHGPPDQVNAAEVILKQLDVPPPPPKPRAPPKNVELTVYMLIASGDPAIGTPATAELEPVIRQLRTAFPYKSFALLDSSFLRLQEGSGGSGAGALPDGGEYSFSVPGLMLTSDPGGNQIHLGQFDISINGRFRGGKAELKSDITCKEGQKVVLGKAGIDTRGDAVFVVLATKIVD